MGRFSPSAGTLPANVNALIATTLPKVAPDIVDNFFTATPFFWWMREKGRTFSWDGGESLEMPIMYDENPMAKAYDPYEVMDAVPPQGIGTTVWRLAHYRVPLMYSRTTAAANRGEAAVVNLVSALKQQAELSLVKAINTDLFVETSPEAKRINPLPHHIQQALAASQDRSVGGISKSTYTWWRNQYKAITSAAAGLLGGVRELYMNASNGSDTPDLALCDDYTFINLETKLSTATRFVNQRAVDFGFDNMTYKGMTIMFDKSINNDGANGDGDGALFMINSKYLKLALGSDANFKILPPEYDKWQDAYVGAILVDCQTVCQNMARQGVLTGGAYSLAC